MSLNLQNDSFQPYFGQCPQKTTPNSASVTAIPFDASACGKAILVGEHAVVYGSHAVALPLLQLRLHISLKHQPIAPYRIDSEDQKSQSLQRHLRAVLHEACELLEVRLDGLQIYGESALPIGAGVGSSAALCIAVIKAVAGSTNQTIDRARLGHLGNQLERRFHGKPSGLDASVVAFECPILFSKSSNAQPLSVPSTKSMLFALIDSKIRASTKTMIELAAPFFCGHAGERRLRDFDALAQAAGLALGHGATEDLTQIINRTQDLLCEIGVVPTRLQEMIAIIKSIGCPATKITGAGGGGVLLVQLDMNHFESQITRLTQSFGDSSVYFVRV